MHGLIKKETDGLPTPQFDSTGLGWSPIIYIANKFHGATDAADSGDIQDHWARILDQDSWLLKSQSLSQIRLRDSGMDTEKWKGNIHNQRTRTEAQSDFINSIIVVTVL